MYPEGDQRVRREAMRSPISWPCSTPSSMAASSVPGFPRVPVQAVGFHAPGDERISGRQELPILGHLEITEHGMPPSGLGVVDERFSDAGSSSAAIPVIVERYKAGEVAVVQQGAPVSVVAVRAKLRSKQIAAVSVTKWQSFVERLPK